MGRIFRYLLLMTPGLAAGAAAFLLLLRRRRRALAASGLRSGPLREGAVCLFWMYCGGMAAITLVPNPGWLLSALLGKVTPYFNLGGLSRRVSLIPFSQLDGLFNLAGNIVMFLPFGFFAALLWRGFTGKRALGLGLGITCSIECWQILVGRCFDVDDIVFNTLGVWGGYLLWRLAAKTAPRLIRRFYVVEILELIAPADPGEVPGGRGEAGAGDLRQGESGVGADHPRQRRRAGERGGGQAGSGNIGRHPAVLDHDRMRGPHE